MILHVPGMDAEVSYAFHSERKRNPEKFKNQMTNQVPLFFNSEEIISFVSFRSVN
jgi:hypothetical protein